MIRITFTDPAEQSAYDTWKAEITQKMTDISIQLQNVNKDYNKLIQAETSKHETSAHQQPLTISYNPRCDESTWQCHI